MRSNLHVLEHLISCCKDRQVVAAAKDWYAVPSQIQATAFQIKPGLALFMVIAALGCDYMEEKRRMRYLSEEQSNTCRRSMGSHLPSNQFDASERASTSAQQQPLADVVPVVCHSSLHLQIAWVRMTGWFVQQMS